MREERADKIDLEMGCRLVVAGGGTGGHLFPGIAIAQAFNSTHPQNTVLFVNAGRPLERKVLSDLGWAQSAISIEGIKGRGRWSQFKAAFKIPGAVWRAYRIIKRFNADVVLSVGGYSAGPVTAAAALRGIPTALHEQNRLPGVTNRILGRLVQRVYLTFEESRTFFNGNKVKVFGNPVRDEILSTADRQIVPSDVDLFTVLIIGGSQGAHAINQAMADALQDFKGMENIRFVHQTGPKDEPQIRQAYADFGIDAIVKAFFSDMAALYEKADMIICRAGATTVAEITVVGKAAVFIPFPFATDDHQTQNAQALVDAGAAEMIREDDLSGRAIAKLIKGYKENRVLLLDMAARARALGRPKAASDIVDDIFNLLTP